MSTMRCAAAALLLLAGCDMPRAPWEHDYKDCRWQLGKEPRYVEMAGGERRAYLDRCMHAQGWKPAAKCESVQAEGAPHCKYEPL